MNPTLLAERHSTSNGLVVKDRDTSRIRKKKGKRVWNVQTRRRNGHDRREEADRTNLENADLEFHSLFRMEVIRPLL
ncbi:hypothetical protein GCM10010911_53570 [Paenibacillus nasutitermitis]|uniref:Uncharacterized protein n=1 Tax=Paenibacillus nasutitermitis TaxID=1652958 RepID=A0A916ZCL8_9BACL|nr:hypothetical protein GCM10010911_53570 [Paenibacillus nasutitermitis]